jgi:hypothetical protein
MMYLFTKPDCTKCDELKNRFNMDSLGVVEQRLTPDNPEALAELAFHGCVELAEKELPILVTEDSQVIPGAIPIKKFLQGLP